MQSNPRDDQQAVKPSVRAGDADRDATAAVLSQALALGYLREDEFGARVDRAVGARTQGELQELVADLPVGQLGQTTPDRKLSPTQASGLKPHARAGVRAHVASWLAVSAICLAVWAVTAVVFGATYFWPIWPILGMGIGVASHAIPAHRRPAAARFPCGRAAQRSLR